MTTPDARQVMQTPACPAGWYPDPAGQQSLRFWDGWSWTAHEQRWSPSPPPPPPAQGRQWLPTSKAGWVTVSLAWVLFVAVVLGSVGSLRHNHDSYAAGFHNGAQWAQEEDLRLGPGAAHGHEVANCQGYIAWGKIWGYEWEIRNYVSGCIAGARSIP